MSSNHPPQLQLSIQPSSITSFKRSFDEFDFDLDSPGGRSDAAASPSASSSSAANGPTGVAGSDRTSSNKRARSSSSGSNSLSLALGPLSSSSSSSSSRSSSLSRPGSHGNGRTATSSSSTSSTSSSSSSSAPFPTRSRFSHEPLSDFPANPNNSPPSSSSSRGAPSIPTSSTSSHAATTPFPLSGSTSPSATTTAGAVGTGRRRSSPFSILANAPRPSGLSAVYPSQQEGRQAPQPASSQITPTAAISEGPLAASGSAPPLLPPPRLPTPDIHIHIRDVDVDMDVSTPSTAPTLMPMPMGMASIMSNPSAFASSDNSHGGNRDDTDASASTRSAPTSSGVSFSPSISPSSLTLNPSTTATDQGPHSTPNTSHHSWSYPGPASSNVTVTGYLPQRQQQYQHHLHPTHRPQVEIPASSSATVPRVTPGSLSSSAPFDADTPSSPRPRVASSLSPRMSGSVGAGARVGSTGGGTSTSTLATGAPQSQPPSLPPLTILGETNPLSIEHLASDDSFSSSLRPSLTRASDYERGLRYANEHESVGTGLTGNGNGNGEHLGLGVLGSTRNGNTPAPQVSGSSSTRQEPLSQTTTRTTLPTPLTLNLPDTTLPLPSLTHGDTPNTTRTTTALSPPSQNSSTTTAPPSTTQSENDVLPGSMASLNRSHAAVGNSVNAAMNPSATMVDFLQALDSALEPLRSLDESQPLLSLDGGRSRPGGSRLGRRDDQNEVGSQHSEDDESQDDEEDEDEIEGEEDEEEQEDDEDEDEDGAGEGDEEEARVPGGPPMLPPIQTVLNEDSDSSTDVASDGQEDLGSGPRQRMLTRLLGTSTGMGVVDDRSPVVSSMGSRSSLVRSPSTAATTSSPVSLPQTAQQGQGRTPPASHLGANNRSQNLQSRPIPDRSGRSSDNRSNLWDVSLPIGWSGWLDLNAASQSSAGASSSGPGQPEASRVEPGRAVNSDMNLNQDTQNRHGSHPAIRVSVPTFSTFPAGGPLSSVMSPGWPLVEPLSAVSMSSGSVTPTAPANPHPPPAPSGQQRGRPQPPFPTSTTSAAGSSFSGGLRRMGSSNSLVAETDTELSRRRDIEMMHRLHRANEDQRDSSWGRANGHTRNSSGSSISSDSYRHVAVDDTEDSRMDVDLPSNASDGPGARPWPPTFGFLSSIDSGPSNTRATMPSLVARPVSSSVTTSAVNATATASSSRGLTLDTIEVVLDEYLGPRPRIGDHPRSTQNAVGVPSPARTDNPPPSLPLPDLGGTFDVRSGPTTDPAAQLNRYPTTQPAAPVSQVPPIHFHYLYRGQHYAQTLPQAHNRPHEAVHDTTITMPEPLNDSLPRPPFREDPSPAPSNTLTALGMTPWFLGRPSWETEPNPPTAMPSSSSAPSLSWTQPRSQPAQEQPEHQDAQHNQAYPVSRPVHINSFPHLHTSNRDQGLRARPAAGATSNTNSGHGVFYRQRPLSTVRDALDTWLASSSASASSSPTSPTALTGPPQPQFQPSMSVSPRHRRSGSMSEQAWMNLARPYLDRRSSQDMDVDTDDYTSRRTQTQPATSTPSSSSSSSSSPPAAGPSSAPNRRAAVRTFVDRLNNQARDSPSLPAIEPFSIGFGSDVLADFGPFEDDWRRAQTRRAEYYRGMANREGVQPPQPQPQPTSAPTPAPAPQQPAQHHSPPTPHVPPTHQHTSDLEALQRARPRRFLNASLFAGREVLAMGSMDPTTSTYDAQPSQRPTFAPAHDSFPSAGREPPVRYPNPALNASTSITSRRPLAPPVIPPFTFEETSDNDGPPPAPNMGNASPPRLTSRPDPRVLFPPMSAYTSRRRTDSSSGDDGPSSSPSSELHRYLSRQVRMDGSRLDSGRLASAASSATATTSAVPRYGPSPAFSSAIEAIRRHDVRNNGRPTPSSSSPEFDRDEGHNQIFESLQRLSELRAHRSNAARARRAGADADTGAGPSTRPRANSRSRSRTRSNNSTVPPPPSAAPAVTMPQGFTRRRTTRRVNLDAEDVLFDDFSSEGEAPVPPPAPVNPRRGRFSRLVLAPGGRSANRRIRNYGDYIPDEDFDESYESLISLATSIGDVKPKSIPPEVIATLKTALYSQWVTADCDTRCSICLEDYQPDDRVLKSNACSHWLHKECFENWLKNANTCPVCRNTLNTDLPASSNNAASSSSASSSSRRSQPPTVPHPFPPQPTGPLNQAIPGNRFNAPPFLPFFSIPTGPTLQPPPGPNSSASNDSSDEFIFGWR